ncbi:hypothetical protein MPH_03987 [Macrophomina phaseolina MS6]|uniref:Uncharacterized protein n=1 Tax=Macrophomina phaseolina (strain MS6) TaxID=1126212 RepID=K2R8L9_MACPH|nr:hypothetical protein MPH_03987 [Macrophomina phaseolina MS6]
MPIRSFCGEMWRIHVSWQCGVARTIGSFKDLQTAFNPRQGHAHTHRQSVSPARKSKMAHEADPPEQTIEVDDGVSEADSAFCSQSSQSTSVTSSVFNYRYENGRRYHAFREGTYALPNDEKEQDRLDLFHHISTLILGGAPGSPASEVGPAREGY